MGSYEPNSEVTGSIPAAPPPPAYSWEGGTPIVVEPGETLETMSRRYNVPVSAIMQANNISNPTAIHPGEHLVIPRLKSAAGYMPACVLLRRQPSCRRWGLLARRRPRWRRRPVCTSWRRAKPCTASLGLYGKPVMVLAKANNIPPDTMVRVGERIVIPDIQPGQAGLAAPRAQASAAPVLRPHQFRLRPMRRRNRRIARVSRRLSLRPPRSSRTRSRPPNRQVHCRASAGRLAAASSPASVRRRTDCRTTASMSRCLKARRSRPPKTVSSPTRAMS